MNPIQYAVKEVFHRIPPQIIDAMFIRSVTRAMGWGRVHMPAVSADNQIREKVIEGRVLCDINLISGQRTLINLTGLSVVGEADFSQLMHIPKERTNGRTIVATYHLVLGSQTGAMAGTFNSSTYQQGGGLTEATKAFNQSRSPIPIMGDGNVQLAGENTILLRSPLRLVGPVWLDCLLEHNQSLSNVVPGAYRHFANLVVSATKAYIYNNIVIPMDEAELVGGMSIGQFRSVVEGYSDAEELYQEHLKIWEKVSILSDHSQHMVHIQETLGGLF